jgi:hypothetical protein
MATRAPFLTQPYGAYYHRDVPHEDEELTHVGPGTPLRRVFAPLLAASGALQTGTRDPTTRAHSR